MNFLMCHLPRKTILRVIIQAFSSGMFPYSCTFEPTTTDVPSQSCISLVGSYWTNEEMSAGGIDTRSNLRHSSFSAASEFFNSWT